MILRAGTVYDITFDIGEGPEDIRGFWNGVKDMGGKLTFVVIECGELTTHYLFPREITDCLYAYDKEVEI